MRSGVFPATRCCSSFTPTQCGPSRQCSKGDEDRAQVRSHASPRQSGVVTLVDEQGATGVYEVLGVKRPAGPGPVSGEALIRFAGPETETIEGSAAG